MKTGGALQYEVLYMGQTLWLLCRVYAQVVREISGELLCSVVV